MIDDLDHKLKDKEQYQERQNKLASGEEPVFLGVAVFVAADPGHESGEEAEEDGAADAAGVAEGFQEEIGVDEGDDGWGEEDEQAEVEFVEVGLFQLEAVGEEVYEGEGEGDIGGSEGEEGKDFRDPEKVAVIDKVNERHDRVVALFSSFDEAIWSFDRDDAKDEELPDEVDEQRDGCSEDERETEFADISIHIGDERGYDDLVGERGKEDREGKPGFSPIFVGEKVEVDLFGRNNDEEEVGCEDSCHEQEVEAVNGVGSKIDNG